MADWRNPLDAFKPKGPAPGSFQERVDHIQRVTARPVEPRADSGERHSTGFVLPFTKLLPAGVGSEVILTDTDTVSYDSIYIERTDPFDDGNGYSQSDAQIIADGAVVGLAKSGVLIRMPGTREWRIRNLEAGATCTFQGYLMSGGADRVPLRPNASGYDASGNVRSLRLTNFGELVVANAVDSVYNNDLYQISENSQFVHAQVAGVGAPVNQVLHSGAVGRRYIVTDLYVHAQGVGLGDLINVTFNFSNPNVEIWSMALDTTFPLDKNNIHHHFGTTGPSTNLNSSVRFTVIHVGGGADGWKVGCSVRYF